MGRKANGEMLVNRIRMIPDTLMSMSGTVIKNGKNNIALSC